MSREESDNALVRRFQRGDDDAFEALVQRHQDRVFRLASVWLYDPQAARDAAQEAFVRSLTGLGRFRFGASVSTWLFRMTRNVCNEMNRQHRKAQRVPAPEPEQWSYVDTGTEDRETLDAVREAVKRLPERQRDALLLRVFEELSVADTARVMGCRPGTVKAHLSKALANMSRDEQLAHRMITNDTETGS